MALSPDGLCVEQRRRHSIRSDECIGDMPGLCHDRRRRNRGHHARYPQCRAHARLPGVFARRRSLPVSARRLQRRSERYEWDIRRVTQKSIFGKAPIGRCIDDAVFERAFTLSWRCDAAREAVRFDSNGLVRRSQTHCRKHLCRRDYRTRRRIFRVSRWGTGVSSRIISAPVAAALGRSRGQITCNGGPTWRVPGSGDITGSALRRGDCA